MKFTEEELKQYSLPLSDSENQKCLNAIKMVRDALSEIGFSDSGEPIGKMYEDTYAYSLEMRSISHNRKVKIFLQGSYANNTNVRTESDVDIAIVQEDIFRTKYRDSYSQYPQCDEDYKFTKAAPRNKSFKDEVQECLLRKFGNDVIRKNKSIKIIGNTYRKDADAVPCLRYRDYRNDYRKDADNYVPGIVITSDKGETIINYPEQHIKNGKEKNVATSYYYKKMVRIIKKIRYIMIEQNICAEDGVSSFGLESLLWNIPDDIFKKYTTYRYEFDEIVKYLYENINNLSNYKEANGIKDLFSLERRINDYQDFIKKLYNFYSYDI